MTDELRQLLERTVVALERIADGLSRRPSESASKPAAPRQYIGQPTGEPAHGQARDKGIRRPQQAS